MKRGNKANFAPVNTCGTCIAFGKSSCPYPATEIDSYACTKYQEACYTLTATSKTIETSKPIMEKEHKLKHTLISVYKVNDKHIVAQSVEDAIKLYKDAYEFPYNEVKIVMLVEANAWIKSEKENEKSK